MAKDELLWGAKERLFVGDDEAFIGFRKDLYGAFSVSAELDDASCFVLAIWMSSRNTQWRDQMIKRARDMFEGMDEFERVAKICELMETKQT